jgi:para-nitrobenzyl esterase
MAQAMEQADTLAHTSLGAIRGVEHEGTAVFKGIRYATAARFAAPRPVGPWEGELDATRYGPQCHQVPGALERLLGSGSLPFSEDCLHLNVFTPSAGDGQRPVLVWIHGGAFTTGSGAMPWYHGSNLARSGDVVVVTLNYRLGALGFVELPADVAVPDAAGPNAGLLDQLTALRWVHDHIGAFGGDPENVTIFGESAGGASVVALLAARAAEGLFAQALAMSPSIPQLRTLERAAEAGVHLLAAAGVAADALPALPIERLMEAQAEVLASGGDRFTAFAPTADGVVLDTHPLATAAASPVPLVIGTTRDEMRLFTAFDPAYGGLGRDDVVRRAARHFGDDRAEAAVAAYEAARPGASPAQLASAIATDEVFRIPAQRLAARRADAGNPTWMHWFTFATPAFGGVLGACHGLDIPYAFDNLARPGVELFTGDGTDRQGVADTFAEAVIRYSRTGDPGWAGYDTACRTTFVIDVDGGPQEDPEAALRALWS